MWHCVKTKTLIHMHRLLMYDDLMTKYQHVKEELNIQNSKKENEIDTHNDLILNCKTFPTIFTHRGFFVFVNTFMKHQLI